MKVISKLDPVPLAVVYASGLSHSTFYKSLEESDLPIDTELSLLRDPGNPFDSFAVKVMSGDSQIGWIPKGQNMEIARLLDAGVPLITFVLEHDFSAPVSKRLQLIIHTYAATPKEPS